MSADDDVDFTQMYRHQHPVVLGRFLISTPGHLNHTGEPKVGDVTFNEDNRIVDTDGPLAGTVGFSSVDPTATVDQVVHSLKAEFPARTGADWLTWMGIDWSREAMSPNLQAALLTILADSPGLTLDGPGTDELRRAGVQISVVVPAGQDPNSNVPAVRPASRTTVLLDATTGGFLQSQGFQTGPGNGITVPLPALTGSLLFLRSIRTPDTTTIP